MIPGMRFTVAVLVLFTFPGVLSGQEGRQPLIGVVRLAGDSGALIPGAEILIAKQTLTTDARGAFRLERMAPGEYPITIRKVGFQPIRSGVTVVSWQPTVVEYFLTVALPDVIVDAKQTGIYGVVANASLEPIAGAKVEMVGNRSGQFVTDSAGRFAFPDARHGAYIIRVTGDGYLERRVMVSVELGKGQEVSVRVSPGESRSSHIQAAALFDLHSRLLVARSWDVMAGADLGRYGSMSVCDVPRIRRLLGRNQVGILNGETVLLPGQICTFQMNEIGLIELVTGAVKRGAGGPTRGAGSVIVWEKR